MFVVEDHTSLEGEERSTNVTLVKEANEVSLEKNVRISNNMEEGPSRSSRGEKDIYEEMKYVPCMKRMEWHGKNCESVNHVGEIITKGRIVACDLKEPIWTMILVKLMLGSQV